MTLYRITFKCIHEALSERGQPKRVEKKVIHMTREEDYNAVLKFAFALEAKE